MTYDVEFSLEAAVELVRISRAIQPTASVLRASEAIRRTLETDPADVGYFLSEGLYYIDEEPLRAFFIIDDDAMVVEITDFRVL